MPFWAMIQNLYNHDVHPPLYFSFLWLTIRAAGTTSSTIMRVPSIVFGALAIPVSYAAGRDLWDRRTGVVAAIFFTVAPLLVWYSQSVRMYSLFMLLALLAAWGQARALRFGRWYDWALFAVSSAALGWTEYFGLFQVFVQQVVFLGYAWNRRADRQKFQRLALGWAITDVFIVTALAPLVPFVIHQFFNNQAVGAGFGTPSVVNLPNKGRVSIYAVVANIIWAVWGYQSTHTMAVLGALWPIGVFVAFFLLGRRWRRQA